MDQTRLQASDKIMELLDLLGTGWAVIANVNGGNLDGTDYSWHTAAIRFRDQYHVALDKYACLVSDEIVEG